MIDLAKLQTRTGREHHGNQVNHQFDENNSYLFSSPLEPFRFAQTRYLSYFMLAEALGVGHYKEALLFTKTAKDLDFNPKAIVIPVGPSNPQFVQDMGADTNYIIGPTQWEGAMSYRDEYFGTAA